MKDDRNILDWQDPATIEDRPGPPFTCAGSRVVRRQQKARWQPRVIVGCFVVAVLCVALAQCMGVH